MTNINLYDAKINGNTIQSGLSGQLVSWFGKLNNTIRLPANFTIQVSADYQSKSVLPQGTGNTGGRGGYGSNGGFGGSTILSAQGYVNPNYGVDIAIKKDFLTDKTASVTISVNDIFKTRTYSYYSETPFFTQTYDRIKDPQVFRLNFSYRFGKMDMSLFKRKNNKNTDDTINQEM